MLPVDLRARAIRLRSHAWLIAGMLGGALFLYVFGHYAPLPKDAYSYRDDAVITLSHARNLIDYGSIGVDPAGARVEGFSTPLQFWLFALAYALTHCGYASFLDWQVSICTFLLGFAVLQLFRPHYGLGLLLTAAVAAWLTTSLRFFGWHHSGMENAYTHALFVGVLAFCLDSLERRRVLVAGVLCAFLASLTRVESILHVAPLLLIWAVAYRRRHHSFHAAIGAGAVLLGWVAYQAWRFAYFGDVRPNTALAEGIDLSSLVRSLADGRLPAQPAVLAAIRQIAGEHRAYLALLGIPLLALGAPSSSRSALVLMLGSLCATGLIHPLLFGPARLDPVRTTSHVALIAPLLVATQWMHLPRWPARLFAMIGLGAVLTLYLKLEPASDEFFCCPIVRADPIADHCLAYARKQQLFRPSLANPDLGKISFRKQFLIFDLGLLGSPPLTRLHHERDASFNYLLDLAAPDFIEMHGAWVCEYGPLQSEPRFRERYARVPGSEKIGLTTGCGGVGRAGVWFRSALAKGSSDPERQLLDALVGSLDPGRVSSELSSCRRQAGRLACTYVARTVYRFLPELARSGRLDQFRNLFRDSPSAPYDLGLLGSRKRGTWYESVVDFARSL
jgi:hypothetical protein